MTARVGVVVATRDRARTLATTLDALRALPERPPVLVADNASRDDTRAVAAAHTPGVRLLPLPRNRGALARNHGVRAMDTPYVAFSDDDSWWRAGALSRAADLLDRHPRLGLVAAAIEVHPEGRPDPLCDTLAASPLGTAPDLPGPDVLGFLGCAAVVRRSAFLDAGGFHPVLFFGAEETLLAYDLSARGWGVAYCSDVVAVHSPACGPRPHRDALVRRNALLTAWMRRPVPVALSRTRALAAEAVRDGAARPAALRALGGALVRLPAALRHRAPLPPETEAAARRLDPPPGPRSRRDAPRRTDESRTTAATAASENASEHATEEVTRRHGR